MITPAYVQTMAAYNAEMNRRVYGAALRLPDAERRADRGAFWRSIHGTLCHLYWGDRVWLARFGLWTCATSRLPSPSRADRLVRSASLSVVWR